MSLWKKTENMPLFIEANSLKPGHLLPVFLSFCADRNAPFL